MTKGGYVYIMSNKSRSVLYIGVTSDLESRVYQHRNREGSNFTKKYNCYYLVYYEVFDDILSAIERERQMKKWKREWKDNVVKSFNPELKDLSDEIEGFN
ncbi:MAG: GIY-YIG nuclease family protein [Bacteroidota bacterium]